MENQSENQVNETATINLEAENVKKMLMQNRIKKMSVKKKIMSILGILVLITAGGYGLFSYLGSGEKAEYLTMDAGKGTLTDSIEATGTLSSVKESEMGFKNDEEITAINVQPGDKVKKGQILATQEATTLNSALQQAIRTVEQDQISIKTANLNYKNYTRTLEQQQKLFDAGLISESDLITAQDNVSKGEWDIAAAQSKLLNDQIKVDQARSDLEGATLAAPFDGIIGAVNGQVGQINGINSNSSTLLTVLSEDLELSALVNEADIGKIKVGQDVEFTSSSYSDLTFKGKVLRITPQAQTVSNVQYYPVLISCSDPEHKLFSGMSVSANIIIARKTDVLTVPMMAVSYAQTYIKNNMAAMQQNGVRPSGTRTRSNTGESTSKTTAAKTQQNNLRSRVVVLQDNKPVIKTVVLGLSDGSNYEVIEGLKQGDKVVVGTNKAVSTSNTGTGTSGNSSNSQSNSNRRNQGGGMGGPPPGF